MYDPFDTFFARRYALGGSLLAVLTLIFGLKFAGLAAHGLIEPHHVWGFLRLYLILALLFTPWFLLTYFTRLKADDGRILWNEMPFPKRFDVEMITRVERSAVQSKQRALYLIRYAENGAEKQVTLHPHKFPEADIEAFWAHLEARRPEFRLR